MDGFDFSNAYGMSMAESNAIGEEAGRKIAEEMMEIGPMEWLSENISAIWIISIVLSLIPVIWFSLATYYKRVSALFHSNRVKDLRLLTFGQPPKMMELMYASFYWNFCLFSI